MSALVLATAYPCPLLTHGTQAVLNHAQIKLNAAVRKTRHKLLLVPLCQPNGADNSQQPNMVSDACICTQYLGQSYKFLCMLTASLLRGRAKVLERLNTLHAILAGWPHLRSWPRLLLPSQQPQGTVPASQHKQSSPVAPCTLDCSCSRPRHVTHSPPGWPSHLIWPWSITFVLVLAIHCHPLWL